MSGRALAAAAVRSGYAPLVADVFADSETRGLAAATALVANDTEEGWLAALAGLAAGRAPAGLVCGSGFEHRANLLERMGSAHAPLGNAAPVVARTADPQHFAAACSACDVPHPAVADHSAGPGWLDKQIGGAGGAHVRVAPEGSAGHGRYRQRRLQGRSVSILFLADRRRACVLGFSDQWCDPAADAPFRYGGGVRPAAPCGDAAAMTAAVDRLVGFLGLAGLNSADFLVGPHGWALLEINPRPGASLDVFPHAELFAMHVQACAGVLPDRAPRWEGAHAAAVVYARRRSVVSAGFRWPEWTADRQSPCSPVEPGAPLCTVLAQESNSLRARAVVETRAAAILQHLEGAWTG